MTTTTRVHKNPYVGPQAFRRGDALYGRDREVGDLVDLLIAERIVLLHSPSGAGKTSLIEARLLPMLEDEGFEVLSVIRLSHEVPPALTAAGVPVNRYVLSAMLSLEEGLPRELQHPLEELAQTSLAQYVAQWPDLDGQPGNEVLVFDQFEEVITADPVDHEAKEAFFADLGATLRDRSLWALFSMREDFVAELHPYARSVPTRFSTRFRLDLLNVEQALDAVELPARDEGVEFDREAAIQLVDDLRRVRTQRGTEAVDELGPHVEPVQLQVTCRQIWEGLGADARRIGVDDIESAGDVNEALAGYYAASIEAVARETGVPERALRDWFEQELVTAQGFRGQVLTGPNTAGATNGLVLELFTAAHLLRAESRRGAIWYELAHDRLTQPIEEDNARWRAEHLTGVERRAGEWDQQGRPDRMLLVGPELEQAIRWAGQPGSAPTRVEQEYLAESLKDRRQRDDLLKAAVRTRRWLRLSVALLVLALLTAGTAVMAAVKARQEGDRAERAVAEAQGSALLGDGLSEVAFDSQLSILLTRRALALNPPDSKAKSWEAANALQLALDASPVVQTLGDADTDTVIAAWSPDGSTAASVDADGTVRLVDARTGATLAERAGVGEVGALDVSPVDARLVAIGLADGTVLLWDSAGDAAPQRATGHTGAVSSVAFDPAGRLLASAGADGAILVARVPDGELVTSFSRPTAVNGLAWSADGASLFAVDDSGALTTWDPSDPATARPVAIRPHRHSTIAAAVDVSADGSRIATGGWDGQTVISQLGSHGQRVEAPSLSGGQVVSVSFTSDGSRILSLDQFGRVQVLDATTGASLGTLQSAGQVPTIVQGSPRDPDLALVATGDADAAIWNTEIGRGDFVVALADDTDDRVVTVAYDDDAALFWDAATGREIRRVPLGPARVLDAALDPRGSYVAHIDTDGRTRVTPLDERTRTQSLGTGDQVLAVSPSGRLIATGGGGNGSLVRIWDAQTGRRVAALKGHTETVVSLDFGATDAQLVSVSQDGTGIVWDMETHSRLWTLRGEGEDITLAEWSPAGDVIATGTGSGAVALWDARTHLKQHDLSWHTRQVYDLSFDEVGQRLVSAGADGYAVIWDVAGGDLIRAVKHSSWVFRAIFSPDGNHLLITGNRGVPVVVWLDPAELSTVAEARSTRTLTETECGRYLPDQPDCVAS